MLKVIGLICICIYFVSSCSKNNGPISRGDENSSTVQIAPQNRIVVGKAAPYKAFSLDDEKNQKHLQSSIIDRRKVAWDIIDKVLQPMDLQGGKSNVFSELSGHSSVPSHLSYYDIDEFSFFMRAFQRNLKINSLNDEKDASRCMGDKRCSFPLVEKALEEQAQWYPSESFDDAYLAEYYSSYASLSNADGLMEIALPLNPARKIYATFNESMVSHMALQSESIYRCSIAEHVLDCLNQEFPRDSVVIKYSWAEITQAAKINVIDTGAEGMQSIMSGNGWLTPKSEIDPLRIIELEESKYYGIRFVDIFGNERSFMLKGMHIMTKETPHWFWISLWWSPEPDKDFGEDRPDWFKQKYSQIGWGNYKMCAVNWFAETDPEQALAQLKAYPSLYKAQRALIEGSEYINAVGDKENLTWCANPYIETSDDHSQTNCIGCHQFADIGVIDDESIPVIYPFGGRYQQFDTFITDYLFSFSNPSASMKRSVQQAVSDVTPGWYLE